MTKARMFSGKYHYISKMLPDDIFKFMEELNGFLKGELNTCMILFYPLTRLMEIDADSIPRGEWGTMQEALAYLISMPEWKKIVSKDSIEDEECIILKFQKKQ